MEGYGAMELHDNQGLRKILNRLGSETEVGQRLPGDGLAPPPKALARWPGLAPWFAYGIYGLMREGKLVHLGKSQKPLEACAAHKIPAPAWMGFREFDRAWVKPSHPDRVEFDLQIARREHALTS